MTQDEQIEAAFNEWSRTVTERTALDTDIVLLERYHLLYETRIEAAFEAGFIAGQSAPKLEDEKSCCGNCEGCRE